MGTHESSICLPGSYACEHQVTNPFVDYLNEAQGSQYLHIGCPDKLERTRAEPDALYRDLATGSSLAVEHKALVWPTFFAERHRNDHLLMDKVHSLLDPEITNGAFVLELPYLLKASRADIERLAGQISGAAKTNKEVLLNGGAISGSWAGREWRLGEDSLCSGYEEGIRFSWNLLDPKACSSRRVSTSQVLQDLCDAAAKKFFHYSDARRILLVELKGNIVSLLAGDLLLGCVVPSCIDEVWTTYFEYFDDGNEDWIYDIKWPRREPGPTKQAS